MSYDYEDCFGSTPDVSPREQARQELKETLRRQRVQALNDLAAADAECALTFLGLLLLIFLLLGVPILVHDYFAPHPPFP